MQDYKFVSVNNEFHNITLSGRTGPGNEASRRGSGKVCCTGYSKGTHMWSGIA